jgi:hypothetical protein
MSVRQRSAAAVGAIASPEEPDVSRRLLTCMAAAVLIEMLAGTAARASGALPRIETNQSFVEQATARATLAIDDPMAVFAFVLGGLPDRVTVYPTENYYYFKFTHGHLRYAGNIRLDVQERDEGKIHFAYFEDLTEWKDQGPIKHQVLGKEQGVEVERIARLTYRIGYRGRSVVFALNDLADAKPPPGLLGPDERYIGPVFDESALRLFLVYNGRLKLFHYLLDETIEVADQLAPAQVTDRILIGKRTGFAFYRDHRIDRKILIGVFEGNSRVNNYFDGPFDQLPDNFIEGETLREAILAVEPHLAGRIDRFGISPGGEDRYLIAPYHHYRIEDDLLIFHECATDKTVPADSYYECFVFEEDLSAPSLAERPTKKERGGAGQPAAKQR